MLDCPGHTAETGCDRAGAPPRPRGSGGDLRGSSATRSCSDWSWPSGNPDDDLGPPALRRPDDGVDPDRGPAGGAGLEGGLRPPLRGILTAGADVGASARPRRSSDPPHLQRKVVGPDSRQPMSRDIKVVQYFGLSYDESRRVSEVESRFVGRGLPLALGPGDNQGRLRDLSEGAGDPARGAEEHLRLLPRREQLRVVTPAGRRPSKMGPGGGGGLPLPVRRRAGKARPRTPRRTRRRAGTPPPRTPR